MPDNSDPQSDEPKDGRSPLSRGEGHSTTREVLLAGVAQAFLASFASEVATWVIQVVRWLYDLIISHL